MSEPSKTGWPQKFERWLVGNKNEETGEHRGYCPLHESPESSSTPSASFNFDRGVFRCVPKCGGMTLGALWQRIRDMSEAGDDEERPPPKKSGKGNVRSLEDAPSKRQGKPLPTEDQLDEFVEALLANEQKMDYLKTKRHITPEIVREHQIGWYKGRYTIPVRDVDGVLCNVRRYDPDAGEAKQKMISWSTGNGSARLYGWDALDKDEIILVEGEMDCLVGRSFGLNTMTHTGGASVWKPDWSPRFEEKTVYVIYDVDDGGRQGSRKAALSMKNYATAVYIVRLPLRSKGADLTDYLVGQGYGVEDLQALMDKAREDGSFGLSRRTRPTGDPQPVTLEGSMDQRLAGKPLEIISTVAGKVQPAFLIPKEIEAHCAEDWQESKCSTCPMSAWGGRRRQSVSAEDEVVLKMLNVNEAARQQATKEVVGIPKNCPRVELTELEQWSVEELVLVPSVESRTEQAQTPIERRAYNVGAHDTPVNAGAKFVGVSTASPKDGRSILQMWSAEQTRADLDRFEMSERLLRQLAVFRPDDNQSPLEMLEEIAADISANVTHIYGRPELHMAYDLVWHSVMDFQFLGKPVGKGWLEMLVIGDTRTGKSEAAERICDHYSAGILKSCEGSTFAGLVGGARQVSGGNSWMVTWGVIPLNDRRLVILDEFSGIAEKDILAQMSAIRSSGRAQITKIVNQETSARTRLIWVSNPLNGRSMMEIPRGAIEAMKELIPNPEDIARFDLALAAASGDVESGVINTQHHDKVKHRYTSELCSALVRWAWSRKQDDVIFAPGVENYVLERAEAVGGRYVPDPPLVQSANVRVKLARIAVALAVRTFSTDSTGEKVLVHKEHVTDAERFLDRLYGLERFGYLDYSRKVIKDREKAQEQRRECYTYLLGNQEDVYVALQAVLGNPFRVRDFEEFGNMFRDDAQMHVRELMRMRMLRRKDKGYLVMEPALIEVLRALEARLDKTT